MFTNKLMDTQCDDEDILSPPDPNKTYRCSSFSTSTQFTLLLVYHGVGCGDCGGHKSTYDIIPHNIKEYLRKKSPPISLNDVDIFELNHNITFPTDFKLYITNVSSCIYTETDTWTYEKKIINLDNLINIGNKYLFTKSFRGIDNLELYERDNMGSYDYYDHNEIMDDNKRIYQSYLDNDVIDNDIQFDNIKSVFDGTINFSNSMDTYMCRCGSFIEHWNVYVVTGKLKGCVMRHKYGECKDCHSVTIRYKSFTEYLENMCKIIQRKIKLKSLPKIPRIKFVSFNPMDNM